MQGIVDFAHKCDRRILAGLTIPKRQNEREFTTDWPGGTGVPQLFGDNGLLVAEVRKGLHDGVGMGHIQVNLWQLIVHTLEALVVTRSQSKQIIQSKNTFNHKTWFNSVTWACQVTNEYALTVTRENITIYTVAIARENMAKYCNYISNRK